MSATRLLILGALRIRQPAHGYEIRRELESWDAEKWANIAYGSIYHALGKLAEEALIETVGVESTGARRPAKTTYTVTPAGDREFARLVREYWWEYRPAIDPFQVAVAFMNQLSREELLEALAFRANLYRSTVAGLEHVMRAHQFAGVPRHVAENLRLAQAYCAAAAGWAEQAIDKVQRDELP